MDVSESLQSFETAWPTACEVRRAQQINQRGAALPSPLTTETQPATPARPASPPPLILTSMVAESYREYLAAVRLQQESEEALDIPLSPRRPPTPPHRVLSLRPTAPQSSPPPVPHLLPLPPSPASPGEEQRLVEQDQERQRILEERQRRNVEQAWEMLDRYAGKSSGARRKR